MTSGPKDAATSDSTSWPRADSPRSTPTPRKRGHDTRRTHRIECNNRSPGDVFIHHHPGLGPNDWVVHSPWSCWLTKTGLATGYARWQISDRQLALPAMVDADAATRAQTVEAHRPI